MHRKAEHSCPRLLTDPKQPHDFKTNKKGEIITFRQSIYFVIISTRLTLLISSIYQDVEFNCNLAWSELKSRDNLNRERRIHGRESKLICITLDLDHFTMSLYREQTEKESYFLISVP